MNSDGLSKVVIVGGGTAGWMAASLLSRIAGPKLKIELIESEAIGTVGVGEATIPQIRYLCDALQIPEHQFLAEVNGSYKLGIEFNNWGALGDSYIHTFGDTGRRLGILDFHQVWLRARELGIESDFATYSFNARAARANKFAPVDKLGNTGIFGIGYAFHFDAGLVAKLLRKVAEGQGVVRTEGIIEHVKLNDDTGFIEHVTLESGHSVKGELFIDCSGFRGLLIGDALEVPYIDWSHWLPANSAIAVQCESVEELTPFTKATAHDAGWQWRIPLQHRTGNGHVYSNQFITDEHALETLLANLDGPATTSPKQLRFTTGRRQQFWYKNCVALGLASGFMEPLESTSIHLVQSGISRLIDMFPTVAFSQRDIDEYNRRTVFEYETIRDFLILHYKATQRNDSEFWRYCRDMAIPDTLQHKFDMWESHGRFYRSEDELFTSASWIQVFLGQNIVPKDCHGIAKVLGRAEVTDYLDQIDGFLTKAVDQMPTHNEYIANTCRYTHE